MTTVANDKLALAVQRLTHVRRWFEALSAKSRTPAEARARIEDAQAIADVLAHVRSQTIEVAAWKENTMTFLAPWAVTHARDGGRPEGELDPSHYDLLAASDARMDGFTRGESR